MDSKIDTKASVSPYLPSAGVLGVSPVGVCSSRAHFLQVLWAPFMVAFITLKQLSLDCVVMVSQSHQLTWSSTEQVMCCWQQHPSLSFNSFRLNFLRQRAVSAGKVRLRCQLHQALRRDGAFSCSTPRRPVPCFPGTGESLFFHSRSAPVARQQDPVSGSLCPERFILQPVPFSLLFFSQEGLVQGQRAEYLSCSSLTTQILSSQRR